jgi:hypothetical protein
MHRLFFRRKVLIADMRGEPLINTNRHYWYSS